MKNISHNKTFVDKTQPCLSKLLMEWLIFISNLKIIRIKESKMFCLVEVCHFSFSGKQDITISEDKDKQYDEQ